MNTIKLTAIAASCLIITSCDDAKIANYAIDKMAEEYVRMQLEVGTYENGYIDAYYGPEEWKKDAEFKPRSLDKLDAGFSEMIEAFIALGEMDLPEMDHMRRKFLIKQMQAARARIRMINGETLTFDEETKALYDAVSPAGDPAEWDAVLEELNTLIPGEGPFHERWAEFSKEFVIPTEKLGAVFERAIEGCKAGTEKYLDLPTNESFTFEFVTDKSWSGYNWYQGGANSLIQVNTDFPIAIGRAVDLGCHEGYPGHHVFNAMLEEHLYDKRGWVEYSVYPLFSPQSLMAEGTANYGIQMAFPGDERFKFETEVLYPIAGISTENAEKYNAALNLMGKMRYNYTDVARNYLDGRITRDEAIAQRAKYGLMPADRAEQSIRFMETYRGYVINYTLGMDLSDKYVRANSDGSDASRWEAYKVLLSTPLTASALE